MFLIVLLQYDCYKSTAEGVCIIFTALRSSPLEATHSAAGGGSILAIVLTSLARRMPTKPVVPRSVPSDMFALTPSPRPIKSVLGLIVACLYTVPRSSDAPVDVKKSFVLAPPLPNDDDDDVEEDEDEDDDVMFPGFRLPARPVTASEHGIAATGAAVCTAR